MPTVYAIQNQHFRNRDTGQLVPKVDVSLAEAYGEVVYVFESAARSNVMINSILDQAWVVLSQIKPGDYLLLMGDPVLIGIAFTVAANVLEETGDEVQSLKWSKKFQDYEVVSCNPMLETDNMENSE